MGPNHRRIFLAFGWITFLGLASCAGRDLRPDFRPPTEALIRQWTFPTHGWFEAGDSGTEFSNAVLFENTLVFGSSQKGLISIYPKHQQVRWALPLRGGVVSPISVEKSLLYFGGGDGNLYAVQGETGRIEWQYALHNPIISRPTLKGGKLFVTTSDDAVIALDAGTGQFLWVYRRRSSQSSTVRGASQPLVVGDEVLTGLSDGYLVSLQTQDGKLKWERKLHTGRKFTDVDAQPVLDDGVLYVPSYDGSLYALKPKGGDTLWRFDAGGSQRAKVDGAFIYLASSDGMIYCLQKTNAKEVWKFELDAGTPTEVIVTDHLLIFGSSHQYLYALDKKTGKLAYRYNVGMNNGFSGHPAWDSDRQRAYFLSSGGNLMAFWVRGELAPKWTQRVADPYRFGSL